MNREELFTLLEVLTLEYKNTGVPPTDKVVSLAARWMNESDFNTEEQFTIWDDVMADLVEKHDLGKRNLN